MARPNKPVQEQRKLIRTHFGEARKRGTVLNDLLGWTDDGLIIHIPTGFHIRPPRTPEGPYWEVDPRAYAEFLLAADPDGWEATRNYQFGEKLTKPLHTRLFKTVLRFAGLT